MLSGAAISKFYSLAGSVSEKQNSRCLESFRSCACLCAEHLLGEKHKDALKERVDGSELPDADFKEQKE